MIRTTIACATTVLLVFMMAGCNQHDAGSLARDTGRLAHDTGAALGGVTLQSKVVTALSLRKGVDMSGLHIESSAGKVTVSGHVRNKAEAERIRQTVSGIRGVDSVSVDQLRVQP